MKVLIMRCKDFETISLSDLPLSDDERLFFQEQYVKYYNKIYLYLYSKVLNKELVPSITSDVFMKAILNIRKFEDRGNSFGSWIYKIASNEIIQNYRNNKKEKFVEISEDLFLEEVDSKSENEKILKLEKALKSLNSKQLTIIQLRYYEKKSFKSIAVKLNISESNAKVRCFRALESLRVAFYCVND